MPPACSGGCEAGQTSVAVRLLPKRPTKRCARPTAAGRPRPLNGTLRGLQRGCARGLTNGVDVGGAAVVLGQVATQALVHVGCARAGCWGWGRDFGLGWLDWGWVPCFCVLGCLGGWLGGWEGLGVCRQGCGLGNMQIKGHAKLGASVSFANQGAKGYMQGAGCHAHGTAKQGLSQRSLQRGAQSPTRAKHQQEAAAAAYPGHQLRGPEGERDGTVKPAMVASTHDCDTKAWFACGLNEPPDWAVAASSTAAQTAQPALRPCTRQRALRARPASPQRIAPWPPQSADLSQQEGQHHAQACLDVLQRQVLGRAASVHPEKGSRG